MPKLSKKLITEYLTSKSLVITSEFNLADVIDLDSLLEIERPKKNMTDDEIEEWIRFNLLPEITSSIIFGDRINIKNINCLDYEIK